MVLFTGHYLVLIVGMHQSDYTVYLLVLQGFISFLGLLNPERCHCYADLHSLLRASLSLFPLTSGFGCALTCSKFQWTFIGTLFAWTWTCDNS